MSAASISSDAEQRAKDLIEQVRQRVVVLVSDAQDLTGFAGKHLRDDISGQIGGARDEAMTDLTDYLSKAWDDGIAQASQELASLHLPPSAVSKNLTELTEKLGAALDSLVGDMQMKVTATLVSASLSDKPKDDVLKDIRELFNTFDNRAVGIANENVETTWNFSHNARLDEAREQVKLNAKSGALEGAKNAQGEALVPCIIDIWMHTPRGGNPPRANHEDMDQCGVLHGIDFILPSKDGDDSYPCFGPKDPALPIGERINCRCRKRAKVIMVTKAAYDDIKEQSIKTGGFIDERFSE